MERFLWICLGGAAGTGARYLIAIWTAQRLGSAFPYGTLIVNLIEVVDDEAHIEKLLPILDEMVTGGALVTLERVRIVKYAAADKR
jgi:PII-like signaling protein